MHVMWDLAKQQPLPRDISAFFLPSLLSLRKRETRGRPSGPMCSSPVLMDSEILVSKIESTSSLTRLTREVLLYTCIQLYDIANTWAEG